MEDCSAHQVIDLVHMNQLENSKRFHKHDNLILNSRGIESVITPCYLVFGNPPNVLT